jgi:hypothetical protein
VREEAYLMSRDPSFLVWSVVEVVEDTGDAPTAAFEEEYLISRLPSFL